MSGGMLRIKTDDGEYEVPEENGEAAMRRLDSMGVKFSADNGPAPADSAYKEPTNPPADKPWYQSLAETGQDALSGFTHGATMHADNLVGLRDANELGAERSPRAFAGAETVGSFVPSLAMGAAGLAGRAGSALSSIGASGLQGMVQGGVRGFSDSDPDADMTQRLQDAATQSETSGVTSAGVTAGLNAASGAAGSIRNGLGAAADKARTKAYGVSAPELQERAAESGTSVRDAAAALVRAGEDMAPPNRVAPISAASYADRFRGAANGLNGEIVDSINAAKYGGAQMPADPRGQAVRGLDLAADRAYYGGTGEGGRLAGALGNEAAAAARGPQFTDPFAMRDQKIALDRSAFKGEPGSDVSYAGQAAKEHADQYRGMLDDYMRQGPPEAYGNFSRASGQYGDAATLRDSTADLAAKQAAGGGLLPRLIGPAAGGAAGYMMGGIPGMTGGAALGYAARNAPAELGADFAANMARGGSNMAGAVSGGTNWLANQAPTGVAVANELQTPKPSSTPPSASEQQQAAQSSRGHMLPQQIAKALQTAPQVLGPYADQLSQAQDPEELDALIERLRRTDPKFETTIVPRFQGQR
jgi:hypothetical protein